MRHLHAGNDSGFTPLAREEPESNANGNPRGTVRESLPLHRLHPDFRVRESRGEARRREMRSDPREFELVTPGSLGAVLDLLVREPAHWTPFAGGTDLMVLYGAGKLAARHFVSLWELPELRRIETTPEELRIGAACTYSDIRRNETIRSEFPLLSA